jgi:hypothetical protein
MAEFAKRTSKCSEHGHPEFRVTYDDGLVPEEDVDFLIDALENAVAGGASFADGSSFQIGWVANRIRADEDGTLVLREPDMIHSPEWWIDTVNHSLLHRRLQRSICASLAETQGPEYPSSEQLALMCDRFGDTDFFTMRRDEAEEPHSGWLFLCDSKDHDHDDSSLFTKAPLFEVAVGIDPRVLPYLALPTGVSVSVGPNGPSFAKDGEPLAIKPGSMIDHNFPGAHG